MSPSLATQLRFSLILEIVFFLSVYLLAAAVSPAIPGLVHMAAFRQFMLELWRAFGPIAKLPVGSRALAIWGNNLRVYLLLMVAPALSLILGAKPRRSAISEVARHVLAWLGAVIAVYILFSNVVTAALVIALDAWKVQVPVGILWAALMPHGAFELFALSWVEAFAFTAMFVRHRPETDRRRALWSFVDGLPLTVVCLGFAAGVESYLSPHVIHALVPDLHSGPPPLG